ncbi:MAG: MFS transporter [Candidatus Tectomicrobia bacterium]
MLKVNFRPADLAVGSRKIHYGWVIVAVASVMWMISTSIRFSVTVLIPHLQDPQGFGWSYGAIAFAFSLQWFLSGVAGPVMGWLGDRYGIRRIMVLGALLFIAGMMLTGTMTHLWQFYLYFGILLGAAMSVFQVPLVSGVTVWFRTSLGVAMGSMQALQSAGTVLLIPLMAFLFAQFGLRWTFWFPGLIGGTILLVLIRPFYNEPADIGLRPFGTPRDEPISRSQTDDTAMIRASVFLRHAKRTHAFWNLINIHFWGCMGHNIFIVFLVAMAIDRGLSRDTAIGAYITLTVFSTLARFLVPIMADWLGAKGVMTVCFALQVFPPFILLLGQDPWTFFLFAGLFGLGMGGEVPVFPIINRQYFGNAPIGTVYGWQMLGNGLGMGLGPLIGGFLWDKTGDFANPVILSSALSLVGLLSVLLLPSTSRVLLPHWEESLPPEARSAAST